MGREERKPRQRRCPVQSPPTEAELQAEAFYRLKQGLAGKGLTVRAGWTWPHLDPDGRQRKPVFDVAIFDTTSKALKLIVELKRTEGSRATYQGERYEEATGAPTIYCRGKAQVERILETVNDALTAS